MLTVPSPPRLTAPTEDDMVENKVFKEEVRMYVKKNHAIALAMKSLYDLVWGQFSKTMISRIIGVDNYATMPANADSIQLLIMIQAEMTASKKNATLFTPSMTYYVTSNISDKDQDQIKNTMMNS